MRPVRAENARMDPVALVDNEGFDALFEEMVTPIPLNRQQPLFAQNFGFYAGNLVRDFLKQLQS
ncbi:hypothetical protein N7447_007864 [Penicillium robsamsonii]|uniref:uncharacterized protein n=1 Tax=Penicillium robsamsonii TaxID=1792511 RepID=UPI002548EB04|nr:uncharacterized protein N7447_007864 [Penicillium robsamsonii]KAJ5817856.1 hypothetical protein N7447_007864 [Penicillium robsamsonii]